MATLNDARRVVVKIGSALLVDRETGALRSGWLTALADDVAHLRASGAPKRNGARRHQDHITAAR
ncbi:MAG: hypothetical protein AAFZ10_16515, partial [Pseudomonadota bacterium]